MTGFFELLLSVSVLEKEEGASQTARWFPEANDNVEAHS